MIGALAALGLGVSAKGVSDYIKGSVSNHFAEKRARDQAALEFAYAKRYAENSPTWTVTGLRAAGLNPILAASGGFSSPNWSPSSPAIPDTNSGVGIDSFDNMLTSSQNRASMQSQMLVNETNADLNVANADLAQAKTSVELLKAEQIKNDLKGGGYRNPIVNDVTRGLKDAAEKLGGSSNSPDSSDSRSELINVSPHSDYDKSTFFGSIQAHLDAEKEISRITGKSASEVFRMSDAEKVKILKDYEKSKYKTKGYHIFTR